ncbi:MAG: carboxypeptidase M32 [Pseudomonadota bacterium]
MDNEPYGQLMAHARDTLALGQVAALLAWDQETMMPRQGAPARAEQVGALEAAIHARDCDARVGEWLAALAEADLAPMARRNVALIGRRHWRAVRVPGALAVALAAKTSRAQGVWAAARAENDFAAFAPALAEIVDLKREEAACLAQDGAAYDALLDQYEPGMTAARLTTLFDGLGQALAALRAEIAPRAGGEPRIAGVFPAQRQSAFAPELARVFGYTLDAGRIDTAVHPFCSGAGRDVRVTTRIDEADPTGHIFSLIHEMGHAVYEQSIDPDRALTPVGTYASMGVHESQSRLFENQIGRSRAFAEWLFPAMEGALGPLGPKTPEGLWRALNRVEPGFIRTEADEVHYNLHIILRFGLERDLIAGDLAVAALEDAWNASYAALFGHQVPTPAEGVLQDVHWSIGAFGYFPSYTIGNLYAAELFSAMEKAIPDLDAKIAAGDLDPVRAWLTPRIHAPGAERDPEALVAAAIGRPPGEAALIDYLQRKFRGLYPAD